MKNNGKKDAAKRHKLWGRVQPLYEELILRLKKRLGEEDDDVGRDALHTALVRLAEGKRREFENWKTYLTKCAVNENRHGHRNGRLILFSELSKEDRQYICEELPGPALDPSEIVAWRELEAKAISELAKLPLRRQTVLRMLMSDNCKTKEIARALGIRRSTVRSHLRHGLAALRRKFKDDR